MPSVVVKLYSVFFKLSLKHRLQSRIQDAVVSAGGGTGGGAAESPFGVTSRPDESVAPANPSFSPSDGVATKDIHIDPLTSLSIRIFLPDSSLERPRPPSRVPRSPDPSSPAVDPSHRRNSYPSGLSGASDPPRRRSYDGAAPLTDPGPYRGYLPSTDSRHRPVSRRLPVMLQFHGGGFVAGSNTSVSNDSFCRRIAKLCDVIVVAVGYRLAPENRYPAAFEDGVKVMNWLAKQANLAECSKSMGNMRGVGGGDVRRSDAHRHIADTFGASTVEPWLAAHADPSRKC